MQVNWTGVYPAVTTKFTPDDALDLDTFGLNLDAQIAAGVHGIILGGTLGEASTLTEAEKDRLLEYALKKSDGRIPVVLNIAEGSTSSAIAAAKRAVQNGADGLMVLPPMRYASDHRETVAYFLAIADATPLPVMVYNNPVDYKTEVTLPMFEELVRHPHIQAVKESTRDVSNVTRLRNAFGDDLKILCGVDTLAMESLTMGADGWVAGLVCAFPVETVAVYNLVKADWPEEALAIYRWFLPLLELDLHPKLVQYIKLAEQLAGIGTEYVRAPRLRLAGDERERIIGIIEKGLHSRPELPTLVI
ncbi:MAG: dihydrodipicolinate synthase family protein [Saprospiraceae bacterium]|nr:dihydrodipicolinate synthase family protein [Saprospiraceae bacterium]MCB9354745.1 dihydrodipicolinate synthase family protein [Lewinellaceae bacterium]